MEMQELKTQQNVKRGGLAALLLGSALGVAGCNTTTNQPFQQSYQQQVSGIPVGSIQPYQRSSSADYVLPAYQLDGRDGLFFVPGANSRDIRWTSDNRFQIRDSIVCPRGYQPHLNQVAVFPDGTYCNLDLCIPGEVPVIQEDGRRGGSTGGGRGTEIGNGPEPGVGTGRGTGADNAPEPGVN